jgi:hypothetical protein
MTRECSITADVYASWSSGHPTYRVYVDNDLLTERDFTWPGPEIFIRENIIVNLTPGAHSVKIEHVNQHGTLTVKNIQVDGAASAANFIISE